MKISIIIPTKNRNKKLRNVLSCLQKQSNTNFEVIVVNDGNEDLTDKFIEFSKKQSISFYSSLGKGVAATKNLGLLKAKGDLIIFIGDDIYPDKKFIQEHCAFHKKNAEVNICMIGNTKWYSRNINQNNKYIYDFLDEGIQFDWRNIQPFQALDYFHFYTSNLSVKKKFIKHIKFDERFDKPFYDDIEFGYRLSKKRMKLIYNPCAFAYHDHMYTFDEVAKRAFLSGKYYDLFLRTTGIKKELPKKNDYLSLLRLGLSYFKCLFRNKCTEYLSRNYQYSFNKGFYDK